MVALVTGCVRGQTVGIAGVPSSLQLAYQHIQEGHRAFSVFSHRQTPELGDQDSEVDYSSARLPFPTMDRRSPEE
jgi:hypothetical protein